MKLRFLGKQAPRFNFELISVGDGYPKPKVVKLLKQIQAYTNHLAGQLREIEKFSLQMGKEDDSYRWLAEQIKKSSHEQQVAGLHETLFEQAQNIAKLKAELAGNEAERKRGVARAEKLEKLSKQHWEAGVFQTKRAEAAEKEAKALKKIVPIALALKTKTH